MDDTTLEAKLRRLTRAVYHATYTIRRHDRETQRQIKDLQEQLDAARDLNRRLMLQQQRCLMERLKPEDAFTRKRT